MMNKPLLTIGLSLSLWVPLCAQAGVKEDFQKIYSEAESAHKDAGNFQWTTTTARLKTAESAAESGDYEKAKAMAAEALQLANESVAQRKKQAEAWKNIAIGG
jgi:hypothetical protein